VAERAEGRCFRAGVTLSAFLIEMLPRDEDKGLIRKMEFAMGDDCVELRKLNQDTFKP